MRVCAQKFLQTVTQEIGTSGFPWGVRMGWELFPVNLFVSFEFGTMRTFSKSQVIKHFLKYKYTTNQNVHLTLEMTFQKIKIVNIFPHGQTVTLVSDPSRSAVWPCVLRIVNSPPPTSHFPQGPRFNYVVMFKIRGFMSFWSVLPTLYGEIEKSSLFLRQGTR